MEDFVVWRFKVVGPESTNAGGKELLNDWQFLTLP